MKRVRKEGAALLAAAMVCLALSACGAGDQGVGGIDGTTPSLPATVVLKTGTIATDSWGYTGPTPDQVSAPDLTTITAGEHTLLADATNHVVSGVLATKVSYSSDPTTLSAAARNSMRGALVCYVNVSLGTAARTYPALPMTVEVASVPAGTTLTAYGFDPVTGGWVSPQTAVVDPAKKVAFNLNSLGLWGIFQ